MDWVKQKMEHARQQRELLQGKSHTNTDQPLASNQKSQTGTRKKPLKTILLLGAATAWIATLVAAWVAGSSTTTFDVSSNDSDNVGSIRVSEDIELRNHITTSMELRKRLEDVDERIQLLTDSMPSPDSRLSSIDQQQPSAIGEELVIEMIQTIEPTAAGSSDTLTIASTGVDKSTVESARKPEADENSASGSDTLAVANTGPDTSAVNDTVKHEVKEKDASVSDKQDSVNISTKSPWVVNLVSLSNKADADRFSARAKSKDIQADQYAVTVKGKQYWRVHVSGFSTAAEAKFQANIIKQKLGLKDVWITKR
jgi:cell division septation protein DedD